MADDGIHQPNDKLFRSAFGVPETAAAFLRAKLPETVAAAIDWPQLQRLPGTFIDTQFRASHTDLLFTAPVVDRDALIYVLFEHQSTRDKWLPLRLLRYMVRIWEQRDRPDESECLLPAILPVVLSQNAQSWDIDPRFSSLLDIPRSLRDEIAPFVPDFSFHHFQLAEMPFEAIPGTPSGILVLRAMKAERLGTLLDTMVWDEELIRLAAPEIVELILRYILAGRVDRRDFNSKIISLKNHETRSMAMTLAETLRQEGRQEGRQEALRESVMNILAARFGRIPQGLCDAIIAVGDEDQLGSLLRDALNCPSLEAFAGHL